MELEMKMRLYKIERDRLIEHVTGMLRDNYKYVFSEACTENVRLYFSLQSKIHVIFLALQARPNHA